MGNQRLDAGAGIGGTQKRPSPIAPQPMPQVGNTSLQVNDKAVAMHERATGRIEHRPAARSQYAPGWPNQFADELRFAAAKARLAFQFENRGDRYTATLLEHGVGIDERPPEQERQPLADRRLARTHHADQNEIAHGDD